LCARLPLPGTSTPLHPGAPPLLFILCFFVLLMALDPVQIWLDALERLRDTLPSRTVKNWFHQIEAGEIDERVGSVEMTLECPNTFARDYVSRYRSSIEEAVHAVAERSVDIYLQVNPDLAADPATATGSGEAEPSPRDGSVSRQGWTTRVQRALSESSVSLIEAAESSAFDPSPDGGTASAPVSPPSGGDSVSLLTPQASAESLRRPSSPDRAEDTPSSRRSSSYAKGSTPSPSERTPPTGVRTEHGDEPPPGEGSAGSDHPPSAARSSRAHATTRRAATGRSAAGRTVTRRSPSGETGGEGPSGRGSSRRRPHARRSGSSNATPSAQVSPGLEPSPFHRTRVRDQLRAEYTFQNFVAGDSNQLARSASTAVARDPGGTDYNPLMIYGGVGLGKTHLAQAIAHHAAREKTARHLCYVSSEEFTGEFVEAIKRGTVQEFSEKYRSVDLLIVDDVQFFGGKEKTQEEFFHLFNGLHQRAKQIVLCADRPPNEIDGIEERLLSRFQWGLTADMQRPDYETRLAILQLKAEALDLEVPDPVLELIAERLTRNIRELEGTLKQLAARTQLMDAPVNVDIARTVISDYHPDAGERQPLQPELIINVVADYYGVEVDDLVGRSRRKEIADARHVAMHFCRELTSLPFSAIGLRFAGRDHSTVIHACKKTESRRETETRFPEELRDLETHIRRSAGR